jgi:ubiquinol-cytochrome c reductase subunit 10
MEITRAAPDTDRLLRPFRSSLIGWGVTAGVAVSLFMSPVPLFQKDVLQKIPFVSTQLSRRFGY